MENDTSKQNIQGLQADVVDLLEEVSLLMKRASTQLWFKDGSECRYTDYKKQIDQMTQDVRNLELRMVITAPMNAGKSTIINAIVGNDLLPSHGAAMTTLPTEVVLRNGLEKPILRINEDTLNFFNSIIEKLENKIRERGSDWAKSSIGRHSHLKKLISKILDGLSVKPEIEGFEPIQTVLTELNNMVRLCSILIPELEVAQTFPDILKIETPFWNDPTDNIIEKAGTLVIVDTPGPNEAGNLDLGDTVSEQLRRSSLILVVLDFQTLENVAAEEVKNEVENIIREKGSKDSLYILVNKIDLRKEDGRSTEDVINFVNSEFKLVGCDKQNRVFEISALWALLHSKLLQEVQEKPDLSTAEMKSVRELAPFIFGYADWKEDLEEATLEEVMRKAERLYRRSKFPTFIESVVQVLIREAAPEVISKALETSSKYLINLQNHVKVRQGAVGQKAEDLKQKSEKLESILVDLEDCQKKLDLRIRNLRGKLKKDLEFELLDLKGRTRVALENLFAQKKYQKADSVEKISLGVQRFFALLKNSKHESDSIIVFSSSTEAKAFLNVAEACVKELINQQWKDKRRKILEVIRKAHRDLVDYLRGEVKPIIRRAFDMLNRALNIDLEIPEIIPFEKSDFDFSSLNLDYETKTQNRTDYKKVKIRPWYYLWLIEIEDTIKFTKAENQFIVSLEKILDTTNIALETQVQTSLQEINRYVDGDFNDLAVSVFNEVNLLLKELKDALEESVECQKMSIANQDQMNCSLEAFNQDLIRSLAKLQRYLKYKEQL